MRFTLQVCAYDPLKRSQQLFCGTPHVVGAPGPPLEGHIVPLAVPESRNEALEIQVKTLDTSTYGL
jgi:hypothetical protein